MNNYLRLEFAAESGLGSYNSPSRAFNISKTVVSDEYVEGLIVSRQVDPSP